MSEAPFVTTMELEEGYRFRVTFDQDGMAPLVTDEATPVGEGKGPSPARLLAAAVGNCLGASALFCLRKAHIPVRGLRATVETRMARNAAGRLRIAGMTVRIAPDLAAEDVERMQRCVALFEEFCTVTQSVRHGLPVDVAVAVPGGKA
jgi:uncharacterized OsmC-like protein